MNISKKYEVHRRSLSPGRASAPLSREGANERLVAQVFDPATDSWSTLGATMAVGRSYAGVAVVELAA